MRERDLQRRILQALRTQGGWWVKFQAGRYAQRGVPDILGSYRGRFVALEVKTEEGGPTELQARTLLEIRRSGQGIAYIVRSVEQAINIVRLIDRKKYDKVREGGRSHGSQSCGD